MPEHTYELALVRHPETEANVEGRFVGRGDSAITEKGREQMLALTTFMETFAPSVVFTSPLKRALVTAQAITSCGIAVNVLDELQEIDFGRVEGLTWSEVSALGLSVDYLRNGDPGDGAEGGPADGPGVGPVAPGGETWSDFEARVIAAAAKIEGSGPRIAVVTHGGVFRALLTHWLALPWSASWRFSVPNAAVARIRLTGPDGVLLSLETPGL